jgi:hypothetical protein
MARSVKISTPIPSLEEVGKQLGLSKSRQNSLLRIILGPRTNDTGKSGKSAKVNRRNASTSQGSGLKTTRAAEG